jgi:hypothetical protein
VTDSNSVPLSNTTVTAVSLDWRACSTRPFRTGAGRSTRRVAPASVPN